MTHNKSLKKTVLILVILSFSFTLSTPKKDSRGKYCTIDDACDPPFVTCQENVCSHKPLLTPHYLEIIGTIVLALLGTLASSVGIGGGAFIVSIMVLFFQFSTKEAISLSNGLMFTNGAIAYFMLLFKKHPSIEHRTLIDYNLAIIMLPPMMIGSLIGSILAGIVPSTFQLGLLSLLITASLYKTYIKAVGMWNAENLELKSRTEFQKKAKTDKNDLTPNTERSTKEKPNDMVLMSEESRHIDLPPQELKEYKPSLQEIEAAENKADVELKEIKVEQFQKEKEISLEELSKIELIKYYEGNNFVAGKMIVVILVIVFALTLVFLRGGKGMKSVVGIQNCSGMDVMISASYVLITISLGGFSYLLINREQKMKKQVKWVYRKGEVELTNGFILKSQLMALIVGLIASMIGIGGNMLLTPILLSYGYLPQVISSTGLYLIFLNKSISIAVFLANGSMPLDYFMLLGGVCMMSVALAQWRVGILIKQIGRQSIISFMFVGVVSLALCMIVFSLVTLLIDDYMEITKFKNYCTAY